MFKHTKRKNYLKIAGVFLLVAIILGSGASLYIRRWYTNALTAVSQSSEVMVVTIGQGSSPSDIALLLQQKGLIRSTRAFETYVGGSGVADKLKAGTFELSANMSTQEIVSVLVQGIEASTLYTISPGRRLDQIRKKMIDSGFSEGEVDEALVPSVYADIPVMSFLKPGASLEGFIFPETFRINPSSTPKQIIRRAIEELDKKMSDEYVQRFEERGINPFDAIILASIIEKEVPNLEDRKKVAQVFFSRLEQGIPLGADATYLYASAVIGGEPFPSNDSIYNTRIYGGLPPGPISNFSSTALEAVAYPADTSYLFYVTGDDKVNYFTSTDAEHEAAVAKYCTITCAPGYIAEE
jgi:UPF0755 protein